MISEEIIDETDQYEDNHSKRRVHRQTTASVLGGCVIFFSTLLQCNSYFFFGASIYRIVERRRRTGSFSETSSLLERIRHHESESAEGCSIVTPYGSV